jgi:hypothetical protein
MKWIEFAAAAALVLAAAVNPALAQDRHDQDQATRGDRGRNDEMRQSRDSSRREAVAAYAQAKRDCGRQRRDERAQCLRDAKEDYEHQMADSKGR